MHSSSLSSQHNHLHPIPLHSSSSRQQHRHHLQHNNKSMLHHHHPFRQVVVLLSFLSLTWLLLLRQPDPSAVSSGGAHMAFQNQYNHNYPASGAPADGMHRGTVTSGHDNAMESTNDAAGKRPAIRQISILGERNSGTRWTFDHIHECFGDRIAVKKSLTRYKHWFQFAPPHNSDEANRHRYYPHDTLVLAQFRNPYDWTMAMVRVPHHSPNHLRLKPNANLSSQTSENDWYTFVTKAWTMERMGKDLELNVTGPHDDSVKCQEDFVYRDIVSCVVEPFPHAQYNHTLRYSEHQPFYEMRNDGSGIPYQNVLELRADKIRNFLSVKDYPGVADAWIVQYEYLLNRGTQHLLDRIAEWTGLTPQCAAIEPQYRSPKKTRSIPKEMAQHLRENVNWTVEGMVGYTIDWRREEDD